MIGNKALAPPVLLAPLAGITDLPFRDLVSSFGAGLVVSEMIASEEMMQARPGTVARAELGFDSINTSVQIAGRDAYWMAECAKLCVGNGAQLIDINMGCPAKKVTQGYSGSALMKDVDFALTLIEAVVDAVDVPVTLKTRLGWDDDLLNAPQLAVGAQNAGVQMITIHGRTRCQFYKGHADWAAIAGVKDAVNVPVIANGDIIDVQTATKAMELSGADGVMVGRGAQGRPWQLAQIASTLFGTPVPQIPTGAQLLNMISGHYEAMLSFYGDPLGNRVARKHLGWYMDTLPTPPDLRKRIFTEKDSAKVLHLIRELPASGLQMAAQ
ncbi:MAG: tRNA dihydrouridine synthase DusB [Amylibacter sp.]|jgi:tRNA-dihydrouridine synthase B|nr:tRNA dihydrouridine synthase DusB [Amylibacter sp.]